MNQHTLIPYISGAAVAAIIVVSAMKIGSDTSDVPDSQTQRSVIASAEQIIADSPDRRNKSRPVAKQTRITVVPTSDDGRARW